MAQADEKPAEPSDNHVYKLIFVYKDTFDFLLNGLGFYRDLLRREIDAVNLDDDLRLLLSDGSAESSVLRKELQKVERAVEWLETLKSKAGDGFEYNIESISHGTIRYLKSIAVLYLKHLRRKRDAFSSRPGESKYVLESLDTALSRYEEKMRTMGVFGKASLIPLLVDDVVEASAPIKAKPAITKEPPEQKEKEPRPILLESIQILDPLLRERCLDLYSDFDHKRQHDRFDTVIAEATRILEDRLRAVLGGIAGTADELVNKAFAGSSPKLRASAIDAEQQAVLLFFKGIFGHIRNPSHHKLLGRLSPERTIQILGMIDYGIYLVEAAEKRP